MLRYKEGFADYQRVLNAQQALFGQQQRYVANKGEAMRSIAQVYRARPRADEYPGIEFIIESKLNRRVAVGLHQTAINVLAA